MSSTPYATSLRTAVLPLRVASLERLLWPVALMLGALLLVAPWLLHVIPNSDDGLVAGEAMLLAAGRLPYHDYFSALQPVSIVFYAVPLKLFGPSYLTFRVVTGMVLVVSAVLLQAIASRLVPRIWAAGLALAWIAWLAIYIQAGPYHYLAVAWVLGMTLALLKGRISSGRSGHWQFLAGVLGGLAVLTLPTMAAAAAAGGGAAFLVNRDRLAASFRVLLGGLAVAVPFFVLLLATSSLSGYWEQTVGWTTGPYWHSHPHVSPLTPLPPWPRWYFGLPARLLLLFTLFVFPLLLFWLPAWTWLRRRSLRLRKEVVAIATISCGLFAAESYRAGTALLLYAAPLALLVLLAMLLSALSRSHHSVRLAGGGALGLLLLSAAGAGAVGWASHLQIGGHPAWTVVHAAGADVYADPDDAAAMQAMVDFARQHPSDRIAYLPVLETMYLLTGETPPVRYLTLLPGVFTDEQVRAEEAELRQGGIRYLVFQPLPDAFLEGAYPGSLASLRGRQWELAAFVEAEYRAVGVLGSTRQLGRILLYERPE